MGGVTALAILDAGTYIQQAGANAAAGAAIAIVGSLIIGGFLAWIARRAQFRREDRQVRDKLIDDMTHTLGALYIKLQVYERFVIANADGGRRRSGELGRRRDDLDATYEAAAVEANALESRLRAYYDDTSVAQAWHGAWDCLVVRYFSMIIREKVKLAAFYGENAGEAHTGLTVKELADGDIVLDRYRELRNQVTKEVATHKMRHGM